MFVYNVLLYGAARQYKLIVAVLWYIYYKRFYVAERIRLLLVGGTLQLNGVKLACEFLKATVASVCQDDMPVLSLLECTCIYVLDRHVSSNATPSQYVFTSEDDSNNPDKGLSLFSSLKLLNNESIIVTGSWKTNLMGTSKLVEKTQLKIFYLFFFAHLDKATILI